MLALFRAQLFYNLATRASIFIHNQVYQSVIRSPVRFFDTKSKGETNLTTAGFKCTYVVDDVQKFILCYI